MFKYMKWEFLEDIKNKKILFGMVGVIYLLTFLLPDSDTFLTGLIYLAFIFILMGSCFLSFMYGAKRTMDTYTKKTFLLESMIPLSPSKILLAKYILAILFDIIFSIVFWIGLVVILSKANVNLLEDFIEVLTHSSFDAKKAILRFCFLAICTAIAFTSFTSFVFVGLKSFFKKARGLKIISYIISYFVLSITSNIILKSITSTSIDIFYSFIMLVITALCFWGSVWFVENKLEIYN